VKRALFFLIGFLLLLASREAFANILGNPSFEDSIGDSFVSWDASNGTSRVTSPPAGFDAFPDGSAAIAQDATSDYTFQIHKNIQPGDLVVFSALAESTVAAGGGSGGQLRIEFKKIDPTNGTDFLIADATSDLITSTNAPTGGSYTRITVSARAPAETGMVVFTIRRQGANAGNVVYDSVNGEVNPVALNITASKTSVRPGDVVTIVADYLNESTQTQSNVELKVDVPAGLDILTDTIRTDSHTTTFREGSTIIAGRTSLLATDKVRSVFQVLVSSGVSLGKSYEIRATVISPNRISEARVVTLRIHGDPTFDEVTVLGKVFDDRNEDGMQSQGEIGVSGARIFTEYGVSVVTDRDGRFHIPAVRPGRHVLKIDGHTLPEGTRFLSEESLVIKTTPGLLSKVRFAIFLPDSALPEEFKKDLQVWVSQHVDISQPVLQAQINPDALKVGLGRLEQEPVFRIKTNYPDYIWNWRIEIWNEVGERVWSGIGANQPPPTVAWNGLTDSGEMIRPGIYGYRMIVRDPQDHEDWTPLQFFRVIHKGESLQNGVSPEDMPATGAFSVFKDGKRSIPLVASPSVRITGRTQAGRRVSVNTVPVDVGPTGEFEQELFVKPGEKKIVVTSANNEGDQVLVEESVNVKDSYIFLVALGEEELGVNVTKGSVETVAHDDAYHEGFYADGRLSYYLKAKIKGKFLIKSRYDTADKRSELFTHLDPEEYYPVYGDYSQIEYEGQDTQERLFLLVEMDRSYMKWGSYHTNFTDTELSRYNRTLSGLKVHYETLSATKYGDPQRGFTLFHAQPNHLGDHNEFRATGGTLYYLRHRNAIPGSEKIRIEIRDKIQDMPVQNRDLMAGRDYEIDYRQGRILLRQPLSSVSASETIISNDILDGNPVYLIADYEFETSQIFEEQSTGVRGFTQLGNHVRIGGTAVEEQRQNFDYDLRGVDATIKAGKNTKITMELSQSQFQQVRQGTSFNGGLSFQEQTPIGIRNPRESAYLIKAETKPLERLEVSGYFQHVEPGFSVERITSQEGFRKYGLQAKLKLANSLHLLGRQDNTELVQQIRLLPAGRQATLEELRSTTLQAVFDNGPWNAVAEYLHQYIDVPGRNRIPSFYSDSPFGNGVGIKVGRRVSDWLMPYVKTQLTSGKNNFQAGGGVEVKMGERTKIFFEEMIGKVGDATLLGISRQIDDKTSTYATIKARDSYFGERRVTTTVGSSHQLSERSRVYSEKQYSTYSGSQPLSLAPTFVGDTAVPGLWSSDVYGYESQFWDRWDFAARYERRHLDASDFRALSDFAIDDVVRTNTFNTIHLSLGYAQTQKWKMLNSFEARLEPDAPELQQWVLQNSIERRINQDLNFLGRARFGTSRFLEPGDLTGRFVEINTGFAYRPVASDRFNALVKYTFLDEVASDAQFVSGESAGLVASDERASIFSIEGAYDVSKHFQLVEKTAYRLGTYRTAVSEAVDVSTLLWANRLNYHITRKWDVGLEYRMLFQGRAGDSLRHGPLVEIDRELYDYIRLGIGYNFTDFDNDLRSVTDFRKNGFFVRLSGKV